MPYALAGSNGVSIEDHIKNDLTTDAHNKVRRIRMLGTILLIVLILFLLGALPTWPYSSGWGYAPSGGVALVLIIVIVLLLTGRL
jgi:hypothetical protein